MRTTQTVSRTSRVWSLRPRPSAAARIAGYAMKTAIAATALVFATFPAAAQGLMYIPLGSDGEIVVVDTERDVVVDRIQGLTAVHGLAGTPDGRFLIAGSYEEREPGAALPAKPSGVSEEEHASHHAPAKTAPGDSEPAVSTLSVVRTADRSIARRIDVPGAVHHVAVSPDGRYAVVTHPNQDTISAIDLTSYEVVATVQTGGLPNYAVFGPGGRRVYVSNAGDGTVSEVDVARWTVTRNVPVGASPEHTVISSDGRRLFVNNIDDGTVSVVDLDKGEAVELIPIGGVLHGIDLSDDGLTLFVSDAGDDKLVAIDLTTFTYRITPLAPAPYHLAAIRGKGKIYVSSVDEPKLWVLDQRDLRVLGEITIGGKGHQMVLAPGR